LVYAGLHAIAPGVVLIKAPGHTPGSQMIFVRLASGREYLFMGDVASLADNVLLQHQRSRYVTRFISGDDRAAVAAQLRAIDDLHRQAPAMVLVPGHDGPTIAALIGQGALTAGFRAGAAK
jgi:glyoxylase-like metal-dependent hydrolase (beta-lactamase superfamily II)